jgi:predicted Zn-dependent protease
MSTLSWGGFGLKDHRTKQTSLLQMIEGAARLDESVNISENTAEGVAPNFQGAGFIRPERVPLIERGCFQSCLTSPRSAKEYDVQTNGASAGEFPQSLDIEEGEVPSSEVLSRLETGLYINNLHYLNYSDRPNCRMTGMTRFATFWVENGNISAPLNVMRFDETLYRLFGINLIGLTTEREFMLDPTTYGSRSTFSARMPGALIEDFALTL